MFGPKFFPESVVFKETVKGHLISVNFVFNNTRLRCFNLYVPSRSCERKLFFSGTLRDTLEADDADDVLTVVEGDFNSTLNPALDRNSSEPHPESARALADIVQRLDLLDTWRLQHPAQRQYSWCRSGSQGRIKSPRLRGNLFQFIQS